ncbi:hypothetical protein FB45DRAFT_892352 [Roridomyces roridus]|uniref:Uncharacterized protein n=1 Tax=Roridomyces roridus TaxID=1738132 RepID=A0AAD7CET5_9AGAR|nr:hypothetical protein FB45DRAFT_892352 [Roridomyces roridus]
MDNPPSESDMPRHQRNLVDLCFEESHYQSAIDVLAQLRSPHHRPAAAHIRQLLFIALYDASPDTQIDPTASPSKRQKRYLLPPVTATRSAQQLLVSFATTNSPSAVISTLRPTDPDPSDEETECFIATESLCISRCKNCWEILAEGFLGRSQPLFASPSRKGKQRDTRSSFSDVRAPVGEMAWPTLDWLLILFERDELENPVLPRHSPLLLEQLGSPSRRDTDGPLNIIIHSLQESDPRRRMMGSRLLNLLINLSGTTHLDFVMLVVSLFNRVSSLEDMSWLMSGLSPTPAIFKFKVALFQKYFSSNSDGAKIGVRPRPQARAPPKGASETKAREPVSLVNKYRAPSSADILRLLDAKDSSISIPVSPLRIKFELLVSYNAFQTDAPAAERDPEWPNLLKNGAIAKALDTTFGCRGGTGGDGTMYRDLLDNILEVY